MTKGKTNSEQCIEKFSLTHLGLVQIFNCVHLNLPKDKKRTFSAKVWQKLWHFCGHKQKKQNKKVSSRKSNVGTPKRILVKKFLKNSHYFYLSNETNRLRPSILLVGRSLKNKYWVQGFALPLSFITQINCKPFKR